MRKFALALTIGASALLLHAEDTAAERLSDANKVFNEIMATPDKGIPQDLLEKAHCVVIVPGMKQAGSKCKLHKENHDASHGNRQGR